MLQKIPNHLGIIIDGNRRWAKKRGLPTLEGHRRGLDNLKKIGDYARKIGVKILTVFCFSTENWNRSKIEVSYLMKLFSRSLNKKTVNDYHKMGVRINIIGQKEKLSKTLRGKITNAEELTKNNNGNILNLAISYGGKQDILQAIKKIVEDKIPLGKINEELINQNLWTKGLPCPDLIIRTGGEMRLSNFLTWQSVYSELYFSPKYWPDFTKKDLDRAIEAFGKRERRFGK